MSLDGSEVEYVMKPLTEDEMVEAVKGSEGLNLEEVKALVMLMSDRSSEWGEQQELVEGLRAGVMTDYGGTVLCNEIQPDPPNRGPNCEAIITLNEGAQPKKQRAMPMHGERLEALGIIKEGGTWDGSVEFALFSSRYQGQEQVARGCRHALGE